MMNNNDEVLESLYDEAYQEILDDEQENRDDS